MRHFDDDEIGTLHQTALEAGLAHQRAALVAGTHPAWLASIEDAPTKIAQLLVDLHAMNTAQLADGSVPFDTWLGNAARLTSALAAGAVFVSFQIRLRGRSMNAAPVPDTGAVPEAGTTLVRPERVIVSDDRLPYTWLIGGVRTGESVLKLEVPRYKGGAACRIHGEPEIAVGTGWVLAPKIVITCRHVIDARAWGEAPPSSEDLQLQALGTRMIVGFDSDAARTQQLTTKALLFDDRTLDIAVLEVSEDTPALTPLTIRATPVKLQRDTKLAVNIIQHPEGKFKRLGFRNNLLTAADDLVLRYFTDTDPGSSGSPLCDDEWRVIGIHRASEETKATKFLDTTTTYLNVGHQIAKVIAALQAQDAVWKRMEPGLSLVD